MTSLGTNFTNANETFNAVASFFGLQVDYTITNVNNSENLFNSTAGNQEFNATFTPGQVIRTINTPGVTPPQAQALCNDVTNGITLFFTAIPTIFTILAIVLILFILGGLVFVVTHLDNMPTFEIDFTNFNLTHIFMAIFVLAIIAVAVFIALAGICTII